MALRRSAKSLQQLPWLLLTGHLCTAQAAENELSLQVPDLELLEFLGSFQTDNGQWIEPESLLTGEFAELLNLASEMEAATGDAVNDEEENDQDNEE